MIDSELKKQIAATSRKWLITGVAGFIGSNLLETLLTLNQKVVGLDNFSTGKPQNLELLKKSLPAAQWANFTFLEGDIRSLATCQQAVRDVDLVLHQAALGSVSRSVKNPIETHEVNVGGFLNILCALKEQKISRFVYASSSSVYGDNQELPKVENKIGNPLSPYAASKLMTEIYASVFASLHGLGSIGLRYFNVFGPRQDPNGDYAAVIPRWISNLLKGEQCEIYGDGKTSRDFCFVANVIEANLRAALSDTVLVKKAEYLNVGNSNTTTLLELYDIIAEEVFKQSGKQCPKQPKFSDFRAGDVRHSLASIEKAKTLINYKPQYDIKKGIALTVATYL